MGRLKQSKQLEVEGDKIRRVVKFDLLLKKRELEENFNTGENRVLRFYGISCDKLGHKEISQHLKEMGYEIIYCNIKNGKGFVISKEQEFENKIKIGEEVVGIFDPDDACIQGMIMGHQNHFIKQLIVLNSEKAIRLVGFNRLSNSIFIGNRFYKSMNDLKRSVSKILKSYEVGHPLNARDQLLFTDLIKYHPDYKAKM